MIPIPNISPSASSGSTSAGARVAVNTGGLNDGEIVNMLLSDDPRLGGYPFGYQSRFKGSSVASAGISLGDSQASVSFGPLLLIGAAAFLLLSKSKRNS